MVFAKLNAIDDPTRNNDHDTLQVTGSEFGPGTMSNNATSSPIKPSTAGNTGQGKRINKNILKAEKTLQSDTILNSDIKKMIETKSKSNYKSRKA